MSDITEWIPSPGGELWFKSSAGFIGDPNADVPLSDERRALIAAESERERLRDEADQEAKEADRRGREWWEQRHDVARHTPGEYLTQLAEKGARQEAAELARQHVEGCGCFDCDSGRTTPRPPDWTSPPVDPIAGARKLSAALKRKGLGRLIPKGKTTRTEVDPARARELYFDDVRARFGEGAPG